jgi:precorrin-6B methylase 2
VTVLDRAFVLARLRPGGAVVATYATIDTAAAAERLGNLVQAHASRGMPVGPSRRRGVSARAAVEEPAS